MTNTTESACQSCGCSYVGRPSGAICGDLSNVFHIACAGVVATIDSDRAKALRIASTARDHVGRALVQVSGATRESIDKLTRETLAAMQKTY